MAAKKLFTQILIYFSKPLRLVYSLIIYEIVNFSFFALYSLLLLSFFLYLKSVPIYVIVHVTIWALKEYFPKNSQLLFSIDHVYSHCSKVDSIPWFLAPVLQSCS